MSFNLLLQVVHTSSHPASPTTIFGQRFTQPSPTGILDAALTVNLQRKYPFARKFPLSFPKAVVMLR